VRDPMIVPDGQTFVTAYNKAPWQGGPCRLEE